jgi:hypothetical protein
MLTLRPITLPENADGAVNSLLALDNRPISVATYSRRLPLAQFLQAQVFGAEVRSGWGGES